MRGVLPGVFVVVLFGRVGFRIPFLVLGFVQVLWPRGSVIGRVGWFIARVGLRLILGPVSRHIVRRLGGVGCGNAMIMRGLSGIGGLVGVVIRLVLMVVRLVLMMVRRAGHDDTPNQSQAPTQHP